MHLLEIKNLHVSIEGKEVIKGLSLTIKSGQVHAVMGKNGSGKTSLSHTLMGHPRYQVTSGEILFEGESIVNLPPEERARKRIFLAFQYPVAIPGVSVAQFLRTSIQNVRGGEVPAKEVRKLIKQEISSLDIPESFMVRSLNDGFSGGEKKRLETLQMRLLKPKLMILDETDSGLDIDSLRRVSESIEGMRNGDRGILLITHYQRMLNYIKPDFVHVFMDGNIVKSGDADLAKELEARGYDWVQGAQA